MARDASGPIKLLDLNRDKLVRDIFLVAPIVNRLLAKRFVIEQEKNAIMGVLGDDRHSQASKLVDVVKSKGLDAFLFFREALGGYCPYLEKLLRHCPMHNLELIFWCEQCECLLCEHCKNQETKNERDHPDHYFTAIFSITETIKTEFDCFIRESRSKLTCIQNRQISSTEGREYRLWAETRGLELRTLVSKTIVQEENWFVTKLSNQQTPSVIVQGQGQVNTGELNRAAPVGQVEAQPEYEDAADLRTLLTRNRMELIQDMRSINPIVNSLYQEGIIKEEEKCKILHKSLTPPEQADMLLDIVTCKGTIEALHYFAKALEIWCPHLAKLLHRCPVHNAEFVLYCENCKVLICEKCRDTLSQHTDHSTTSTTTIVTMCKAEFDRFILENRESLMDIRLQKKGPKEQEKRVKKRGEDLRCMVTEKIEEEVNMFINNLDEAGSNSTSIVSLLNTAEEKGKRINFKKIAKIAVLSVISTVLIRFAYTFI